MELAPGALGHAAACHSVVPGCTVPRSRLAASKAPNGTEPSGSGVVSGWSPTAGVSVSTAVDWVPEPVLSTTCGSRATPAESAVAEMLAELPADRLLPSSVTGVLATTPTSGASVAVSAPG
ncbi:hypothetical protein AB0M13_17175 [Nocardia fluminea]|uniref:hypothetical protein n=1 Tax=Nocardia fluminea TaxID=134984 RepID=UPI0034474969